MTNLITIIDIQKYKPLSKNIDTAKKVDPFIQEAQEFDLRPFLSDEFYLDLISDFLSSPSLIKYNDLFFGSIWTKGSRTYENPGIISMLCYYSYARYQNVANTNQTAFGTVGKNNPDSTPITDKTINRLVSQADSGAKAFENRVRFYLDCNPDIYPLWECGISNKKTGTVRISQGGGNSTNRRRYDPINKRYYYE